MSQAGIANLEKAHPEIPTSFVTDSGTAVPVANTLDILGTAVVAGSIPVETTGVGNVVTIEVQRSQAIAATDATKVGLAAFDSASFSVDSNGFVTLAGGGLAIDSIAVQTGTSPVVPTGAGLVTFNGAVVSAGTNPVRTDGTGANTLAIEIQKSQAIASADATKIGLSNFDSAAFDVDANGFVQLNGGGVAATSFDVQANTAPGTDPVVPSAAGVVTVNGSAVANHSVVLETRSRAANTYNLEVQYATSAAATDATKSGVAHFNSTQFSVDANGFVELAGGGLAIDSIHPDSGTDPVVPTAAGLVNIVGSGSTTTVGSLNTLTVQMTGLTNHAVLVGAGTSTITKVGPTATSGQVLQSSGAAADPAFSTATYPATTTVSEILYSSSANTVSGLATANRGILTTGATGVPVITALATDGQLIIGSTAGVPAAASLSSSDSSVTITPGSNSISLTVAGGTTVGKTITGNSGGALSPTAGNWNIVGTGSTTASGSGSTLTVQMTGLTNHNVLVGAGTATITNVAPSSTSGVPLISNGSSADPSFGTALVAGGGTGRTSLTNHGVLVGAGTSAITQLGTGSAGQVLQSGGASADPTYSTATYPSTATSTGTILRADGTNWVATTATYPNTTTANQLLYSSATNTVGGLTTANNGILNTDGSGVPSITITPTLGSSSTAASLTIGSNSTTCFSIDNGVAHGTIPLIDLYHDSATVATDYAYEIDFNAQNSTPAKKTFASIQTQVAVNTASSEMGTFLVNTINAGSSQVNIKVGNNLGQYRGTQTNTAPPAGYIGEQITSAATSVSLSNDTAKTVTSINLTAGIWDISAISHVSSANGTLQYNQSGISTTTNTLQGNIGDQQALININSSTVGSISVTIPQFRATLSTTTTYYIVAQGHVGSSTMSANARITGTRVG